MRFLKRYVEYDKNYIYIVRKFAYDIMKEHFVVTPEAKYSSMSKTIICSLRSYLNKPTISFVVILCRCTLEMYIIFIVKIIFKSQNCKL